MKYCAGSNPTIVSYNVSVVKIYNTTGSLVRFETKNMILYIYRKNSVTWVEYLE
jgi:hypothetical protein